MTSTPAAPWWIGAVGYEIYPRSFSDSNGDGMGDLEGIRQRLPYLADLGVDAVWMTPFYPSPGFDHGYDVADYRSIDPMFGTLDDFDRLVTDAHDLDLRVMVDLVPNHTSSSHPWFREALQGRDSPTRDYFIWRDPAPDGGPPNNWLSHFGGPAWTLDPASGQYYCHLFLPEQPDLNWTSPAVADEFDEILRFWCERGADGFRIDVAHGLVKDPRFRDNPRLYELDDPDPQVMFQSYEHRYDLDQNGNTDVFRRWNRVVEPYGAVLVGETNLEDPVRMARYHDGGAALHRTLYLGPGWLRWDPLRLRDGLRTMHLGSPDSIAWIVDSHDTPHSVTRFGGGAVGARRSLCVTALMMALGGMPFLYQGQELGIGDGIIDPADLADPISVRNPGATTGRDGARTAMPWNDGPGNGFTTAAHAWLPAATRSPAETVAGQLADPGSALHRYIELLRIRRSTPELWTAPAEWIDTVDSLLVAMRRGPMIVAANLDEYPAALSLPPGHWIPVFSSQPSADHPVGGGGTGNQAGQPLTGSTEIPAETTVMMRHA